MLGVITQEVRLVTVHRIIVNIRRLYFIDGGGAYIDFAEATLTRNDISDIPIHMFYDTIMRDNGTLETAVRQNDVIQIDL